MLRLDPNFNLSFWYGADSRGTNVRTPVCVFIRTDRLQWLCMLRYVCWRVAEPCRHFMKAREIELADLTAVCTSPCRLSTTSIINVMPWKWRPKCAGLLSSARRPTLSVLRLSVRAYRLSFLMSILSLHGFQSPHPVVPSQTELLTSRAHSHKEDVVRCQIMSSCVWMSNAVTLNLTLILTFLTLTLWDELAGTALHHYRPRYL